MSKFFLGSRVSPQEGTADWGPNLRSGLTVDADVRVRSRTDSGEPRKNIVAEVYGGSGIEREDVPGGTALAEHAARSPRE